MATRRTWTFYAAEGGDGRAVAISSHGILSVFKGRRFPSIAAHLDYLLRYNTRYVSGDEPRGYGYEYPGSQ
jgi:hypothetical protein